MMSSFGQSQSQTYWTMKVTFMIWAAMPSKTNASFMHMKQWIFHRDKGRCKIATCMTQLMVLICCLVSIVDVFFV